MWPKFNIYKFVYQHCVNKFVYCHKPYFDMILSFSNINSIQSQSILKGLIFETVFLFPIRICNFYTDYYSIWINYNKNLILEHIFKKKL